MKGMDRFFCASSASTAIMDQRAIVRRAHRVPINDHVYVHDRRKNQPHLPMIPCSFDQLPIDPKPLYERCRRSFSSAQCSDRDQLRRKSSADIHEQRRKSTSSTSRYRISDGSTVPFIDWLSETDATLVPSDHHKEAASNPRLRLIMRSNDEYRRPSPAPLRSSSTRSRNQRITSNPHTHIGRRFKEDIGTFAKVWMSTLRLGSRLEGGQGSDGLVCRRWSRRVRGCSVAQKPTVPGEVVAQKPATSTSSDLDRGSERPGMPPANSGARN